MIKVSKNLATVPASLLDNKTNTKRNICIRSARYINEKHFNQRFKQQDTKNSLKKIYHNKCAFCEQKLVNSNGKLEENTATVEHYRPKGKYWWLAYSWDNLLLCCHRCNQNKKNDFDINGIEISYEETFLDVIHTSTQIYSQREEPKIIHPDFENVTHLISFNNSGKIDSQDERVKYTIDTYKIDRADLNEKRQKIIDDFVKKVNEKKLKKESYKSVIISLIEDMKNKETNFIALHHWIISNQQNLVI